MQPVKGCSALAEDIFQGTPYFALVALILAFRVFMVVVSLVYSAVAGSMPSTQCRPQ